jgi:transposase
MTDAARTIKKHWEVTLRWRDSRVTDGVLEGPNSLIYAAKEKARGYRTSRNLVTMTYLLTGRLDVSSAGLPTLNGEEPPSHCSDISEF